MKIKTSVTYPELIKHQYHRFGTSKQQKISHINKKMLLVNTPYIDRPLKLFWMKLNWQILVNFCLGTCINKLRGPMFGCILIKDIMRMENAIWCLKKESCNGGNDLHCQAHQHFESNKNKMWWLQLSLGWEKKKLCLQLWKIPLPPITCKEVTATSVWMGKAFWGC